MSTTDYNPVPSASQDPVSGWLGALIRCTDARNATRLVVKFGENLRYSSALGGWLYWNGKCWSIDECGYIERCAKNTAREIYFEAYEEPDPAIRTRLAKWAATSENTKHIQGMIYLAQSEPPMPVKPSALDKQPMLLNLENGTLDLETLELREHRREDLITHLAPVKYDPSAKDTMVDNFINTVTNGDLEFADYLQRAVGYSLTGLTDEEVVFFVLGPAATGKSTLVEALLGMLGDYAVKAPFDTFLQKKYHGGPRADIVRMRGSRLVAAVEPARGSWLAENEIKELAGGDSVTARGMYAKYELTYIPTFKVWLAANEAPNMRDDDSGLWRRIKRLPFENEIPEEEQDPNVKRRLREDPQARSALLAWAVQGCREWQRDGLTTCKVVKQKTLELRASFDPLGEFLAEYCVLARNAQVPATELRTAYENWAREMGAKPLSDKEWGKRLRAAGCVNARERIAGVQKTVWRGIGLKE